MAGVRRAFILNAAERYAALGIQFLTIASVSRLLTPAEIGVSVIGTGIMAIALAVREFATPEFLIQRRQATREDVRTSFTVLTAFNLAIAAGLFALTPWFTGLYGEEKLARFLYLTIVACVVESFAMPITALLRRDMAFGTLAVINTAAAATGAAVTVVLAVLGFSYMSVAWAFLAMSTTTTLLSICFRPDVWIFRPSLHAWRSVFTFGGYHGGATILTRAYDALPQLVLGSVLPMSAVGLYNRANTVCSIPDRFVLSGVFAVAFPAFAAEVRAGRDLKGPYLRALGYITVLHWPGLVVLALLAHPVVALLLGDQWLATVPLVQILCVASLFWFPVLLTYPVLVSIGAIRANLAAKAISVIVSGAILCLGSLFGILVMAATQLIALPFQMAVALFFVRRHIPFEWAEVPLAVGRSAVVTACSCIGPVAVVVLNGGFDLPLGAALPAGILAGFGWAIGLVLARHPFLAEIRKAIDAFEESAAGRRLGGRRLGGWRLRRTAAAPAGDR